jgi:hypothetical protein
VKVTGFEISFGNISKEFRISQYADDTCIFLKTHDDIQKTFYLLDFFGSLSGLVLNKSKTKM